MCLTHLISGLLLGLEISNLFYMQSNLIGTHVNNFIYAIIQSATQCMYK